MSTEDDFAAFRRVAGEEIAKLREENAALRAHAERVGQANDRLVVENDDLRKDKARLDWFLKLEEDDRVTFCRGWYRWTPEMVKAEIDAELRKEAQQ